MKKRKKTTVPMIVDPLWLEEHPEYLADEKATNIRLMQKGMGYDPIEYYPEDYGIDFTKMQWIMIRTPPNTSIRVPKLSIWLAKPSPRPHYSFNGVSWKLWNILTPYGTLGIRFHESIVVDLTSYEDVLNTEHCLMKTFGQGKLSTKLSDQMFYLQSRGIGKLDSMKLILRNIDQQDICYFVFHIDYQKHYERNEQYIFEDVIQVKQ